MITMTLIRSTLVASLAFATSAAAQSITFHPGAGNLVVILAHDAKVHADAVRAGLRELAPMKRVGDALVPAMSDRKFREKLKARVTGSTVARIDYRSHATGEELSVHARSGRSVAGLFDQLTGAGKADGSGSTTEAGASISPQEAGLDASEARWYPPRNGDIRATNLQRRDDWVVEPSAEADGRIIHGTDAELKALRQLEQEFENHASLASQGGEIRAYVSKTVCPSCSEAFGAFARKYNVSGKVYYLNETDLPASAALPDTVIANIDKASKASSVVLRGVRKQITAEVLSSEPGTASMAARWYGAFDATRLAAAEAGTLATNEACADE